ncbi:MauE/DoxX family redox-associated membrane protein [Streptomyces sp. NPDC051940]|uniref:MauE/DoxX family redox-associated membrane protein n=1 Tax=Streptomyces sp. NPDC051940 TaxID=3155675 RepID=UPI0034281FE7
MTASPLALAALVLGVWLAASGAAKAFGPAPRLRGQAVDTALERRLRIDRAVTVLRVVGAVELCTGLALLAAPGPLPGLAAVALGLCFTAYLAWARATAPESSCGCTAGDDEPIGARAFTRALSVSAGGAAVASAPVPWWSYAGDHPAASVALLALGALAVEAVRTDLRMPARRLRVRLLGHPLGGDPASVPAEGSVELLERSVAWETLGPVVRSGLLEHWDDADGWRFLRYAGVYGDPSRPVSVVFAVSSRARLGGVAPAVRVAVVDPSSGEVIPTPTPEHAA